MKRTDWTEADWRDLHRTIEKFKRRALARHAAKQGEAMPNATPCRSCGAKIIWTETEATGKKMPIDYAEDAEKGNIVILDNGKARVLGGDALTEAQDERLKLHTSHFATCPNAKSHRKPK